MSQFTPFDFGAFRLQAPLGKGGMGEVFRAVHRERQFPVAIKIMNARRARDPEFRYALRQEIRAVARLYHPAIIMVFDCGAVPEEMEFDTRGRFVAGSSWFAMELATHSLDDLDRDHLDWWHVRNIFIRILDALSHSHARGVIHRDLKPGNVLFVDGPDGRQLKLTDFGLAHALDDHPDDDVLSRKITGTPRFMSPEQITGEWRDHGPWTDLYALGCMAYWLVDGEPPFRQGTTDQILEAHLDQSLPPLHAPFAVPAGFGNWLGRLLAKNPADRFQRAADAARALFALGNPADGRRPDNHPRLSFKASLDDYTAPSMPDTDMGMTEILSDIVSAPSMPELQALARPRQAPADLDAPDFFPIPQTWHRREPPPLSADLIGVGLGLFGLRQVPFVDRIDERNHIWEALRQVGRTRQPRLILLRGATGTGKSRLASWIGGRAHELGAATPLRATHSPMGGARDGLAAMFANHLRCVGLTRDEIVARIRHSLRDRQLDPDALHDCLAMTEIIAPAVIDNYREEDARIRFRTAEERHAVIFRFLERLARHRPLLLFLDDLQWGNETLNALEYLVANATRRQLPLLVLGTIQADALVDRPVARDKIEHLERHDLSETLAVGPLPQTDHRLMIRGLLGLEESLVDDVANRTAGNPLYAVQLVGDWVQRGVLELGSQGFRLRPGERAPLPNDLQELFRDRLAKLVQQNLDDPANNALKALELAAVLGTEVHRREWADACRRRDLPLPLGVLETMVANDLAILIRRGWSFSHQAFRETLLHTAEQHQRLADHHLVAVETLRALYPADHPELALSISRHLEAANQLPEALEPILDAARQARIRWDFELAHELYRRYTAILDELQADDHDRRRARGWVEEARTLTRRQKLAQADQLLTKAEQLARQLHDQDLLADALLQHAIVANDSGKIADGMKIIGEARQLYQQLGDTHGRARAELTLADLRYWAGDYYDAERAYLKARQLFSRIDDALGLARTNKLLGSLYTTIGDIEQARSMLDAARQVFEDHGDLGQVAYCLNNLGEAYRAQSQFDQAYRAYEQANQLLRRIGLGDDPVILSNLGMVRLAQDRVDDADPIFREVLEMLAGTERRGYLGLAHLACLPASAHRRHWTQWDFHLARARLHLDATGLVDADIASLARDAGLRALVVGEHQRARQALMLARAQWLHMGRQDRAAEIDRIIPD